MPFRFRYNKIFPGLMLVASVFILGVALTIASSPMQLVTGSILLLVSLLQLTMPVAEINESEICLKNLFGMTLKRLPYKPSELSFSGNRLMQNGRKVPGFTSWVIAGSDIDAFRTYLQQNAFE